MKNKYIFSFLILILLIGVLSPIIEVGAQGAGVPEIKPSAPTPIDVLQKDQEKQIEELLKISEEAKKNKLYSAEKTTESTNNNYILLEPIPCKEGTPNCKPGGSLTEFNTTGTGQLGTYLNLGITLFIGLCAVAAVIMIVIGGIEYSTAELVSNKAAAKERIQSALLGLLLALCSWLILNTINPDLLRTDFEITGVELGVDLEDIIIVDGDGNVTSGTGGPINMASVGTSCDYRTIFRAAQQAGVALTEREAGVFACLITPESGCKSVRNYAWGSGSTAYGVYQILLQSHSARFENPACWAAAGVRPISCSRGFRNGNPLNNVYTQQCMRAADNFICSTAVAVSILRSQGFSAWTADANSAKQRRCIARLS